MYAIIPLLNCKYRAWHNARNVLFSESYDAAIKDIISKYQCEVIVTSHYYEYVESGVRYIAPTTDRLLCTPAKDGVKIVYQKICPNTGIIFGDVLIGTVEL